MKKEEVASVMAEAILNEPYLSKESIKGAIEPLLKVWFDNVKRPKLDSDAIKAQAKLERMQTAIVNSSQEKAFLVTELRGLYNPEQMKDLFYRIDKLTQ